MRKFLPITMIGCLCLLAAAFVGAAAEAPGTLVLDSLKDVYSPVEFDHAKHVSLASGCSACHHEHAVADGLPCKNCHALNTETFRRSANHSFMACRSCHTTADRDNAAMPGLKTAYHKACFTCHRGMGNIGTDPKGCAEICHARKADTVGMDRRN